MTNTTRPVAQCIGFYERPPFRTLQIDFSGHGMKKEQFFLEIQKTIPLNNVTDLILRDNEFDSFLDCSTNLVNLRSLDLSQNHLQRFFFLCNTEYNLEVLNVSHNKLEYIDDTALNDRILKLKILDLSSNKLSTVNETMLQHFKRLEYLSLANNPINDAIHESAFWNLTSLRYLNLSNMAMTQLPPKLFKGLSNLTSLDLSGNPIKTLPFLPTSLIELDLSNTSISKLQNISLPRLKEIKLNTMPNLTELSLNDFQNLSSLEVISLVGSKKLAQLKLDPFTGRLLPQLQRLTVRSCGLTMLNYTLLPILKRTPIINLEWNPWHCDCKMQWITVRNSTKSISREILCHSPNQYRGKILSEIQSHELVCDNNSPLFYPILWICILLLIVAIMLAIGFFLLKGPIGHWDIGRKNRDTVSYTNVDESSNDMVRILAVGETVEHGEE